LRIKKISLWLGMIVVFVGIFLQFYTVLDLDRGVVIGEEKVVSTPLEKGTIFISPDAKGKKCTKKEPCSLAYYNKNIKTKAGDVIFFRGGVYKFSLDGIKRFYLKGGSVSNPVIYESYPNELAIFDGSNIGTEDTPEELWREGRLELRENYTYLRKVEIRNMPLYGVRIFGNYNVIEGCTIHNNHLSGLEVYNFKDGDSTKDTGGSYNVIKNNIIFNNSDEGLMHHNYGDGNNADGIVLHSGVNNVLSHNRVYSNSDDGIDTWKSMNTLVEYNLVYKNGKGLNGNGNGIKLGGTDKNSPLGSNAVAKNNISYLNRSIGININAGKNVLIEQNTVYKNGDFGYTLEDDTTLISNIAFENKKGNVGWSKGKSQLNNSWQEGKKIEFKSTDINSIDFLKPVSNSNIIKIGAYFVPKNKKQKLGYKDLGNGEQ
jgi:parallel beta-helix repeat protein